MILDDLPQTSGAFRSLDELARCLAEVAIRAGAIALHYFNSGCEIEQKRDGSPVTLADTETQRYLCYQLGSHFPGLPICGEEDPQVSLVGTDRAYFLLDPVDGTKEFIKGTSEWTVNIGLILDGRPIVGAVALPAEGIVFWGGTKAFRSAYRDAGVVDPQPIHVREPNLRALRALCSRDHQGRDVEGLLERLNVTDTLAAGSSLKSLRIAEGDADLYPRLGTTMAWDTAAAHAVLLSAGGDLFDCDGSALRYDPARLRNPHFVAFGQTRLPNTIVAALRVA